MVHAVNEKPESLKGCNSCTITQEGDSHIKLFISSAVVRMVFFILPLRLDYSQSAQTEILVK